MGILTADLPWTLWVVHDDNQRGGGAVTDTDSCRRRSTGLGVRTPLQVEPSLSDLRGAPLPREGCESDDLRASFHCKPEF